MFGACVKDRVQLNQGKEDLETGRLVLSSGSQWPLAVGLLLLHLKFQTEPLISSDQYEQCCNVGMWTGAGVGGVGGRGGAFPTLSSFFFLLLFSHDVRSSSDKGFFCSLCSL